MVGYRPNDRFELSGRWRYAGGRPYSPFDPVLSAQAGAGIVRRDRINGERHAAYHRLDLRFDHRRHYRRVTLVSFFSVLNVVFVTAYDTHAVEAFERAAVDYLLKPVLGSRLRGTVDRLKRRLAGGNRDEPDPQVLESLIRRLADTPEYLHWLRVGQGERVELVAVDDVCFFRSDRKYTAAVTRDREHLVRTPISELAARLDPGRFWRIHRGGIVNVAAIEAARRDLRGRYRLTLKERPEVLRVSAAYGHLFRRM